MLKSTSQSTPSRFARSAIEKIDLLNERSHYTTDTYKKSIEEKGEKTMTKINFIKDLQLNSQNTHEP